MTEAINSEPMFVDVVPDDEVEYEVFSHTPLQQQEQNGNIKTETTNEGNPSNEKTLKKNQGKKPKIPCLVIQNRRIRCPECIRYTAETEEKMMRHVRKVHRGENPFQCYMCDYSTYNKALFEEHVRIHQGIKPFKCSHCPYRSASKKNVKKHELIHRPNNPLKCPDCDFIARHPRSLECHKYTHNGGNGKKKLKKCDKFKKCQECSFKTTDNKSLVAHKKSHKFKCDSCDYVVNAKMTLKNHMLKKHPPKHEDDEDNIVKKECLFNCAICKWTSNNKPRILLHLIHHPDQSVDEDVIDISILRKFGIM